jgi:hypothetical protein
MGSSYRFPTPERDGRPTLRMMGSRMMGQDCPRSVAEAPSGGLRDARDPSQASFPTTSTSSSVISPSTMRNERNWNGPSSFPLSAVETST